MRIWPPSILPAARDICTVSYLQPHPPPISIEYNSSGDYTPSRSCTMEHKLTVVKMQTFLHGTKGVASQARSQKPSDGPDYTYFTHLPLLAYFLSGTRMTCIRPFTLGDSHSLKDPAVCETGPCAVARNTASVVYIPKTRSWTLRFGAAVYGLS